jgi:mRNA interferase MazF
VIFDRYDVAVVPFPFHEIPVRKRRPCIILSGRRFNEANGWTVMAMITTAKQTSWPSDVLIADLGAAGLQQPCVVRWRLQELPRREVQERVEQVAGERDVGPDAKEVRRDPGLRQDLRWDAVEVGSGLERGQQHHDVGEREHHDEQSAEQAERPCDQPRPMRAQSLWHHSSFLMTSDT